MKDPRAAGIQSPWSSALRADVLRDAKQPPRSLVALHAEHGNFVWATLQRFGIQHPDLEDAFQDVFVVVQQRLPSFDWACPITTWLFAICRRGRRVAPPPRPQAPRAARRGGGRRAGPARGPEEITQPRGAAVAARGHPRGHGSRSKGRLVVFEIRRDAVRRDQRAWSASRSRNRLHHGQLHAARKEVATLQVLRSPRSSAARAGDQNERSEAMEPEKRRRSAGRTSCVRAAAPIRPMTSAEPSRTAARVAPLETAAGAAAGAGDGTRVDARGSSSRWASGPAAQGSTLPSARPRPPPRQSRPLRCYRSAAGAAPLTAAAASRLVAGGRAVGLPKRRWPRRRARPPRPPSAGQAPQSPWLPRQRRRRPPGEDSDDLVRESNLVDGPERRSRDPEAALAALEMHQAEFPKGRLAEELEFIAIRALSASGAPIRGGRAAAAFFARQIHRLLRRPLRRIVALGPVIASTTTAHAPNSTPRSSNRAGSPRLRGDDIDALTNHKKSTRNRRCTDRENEPRQQSQALISLARYLNSINSNT